MRDLIYLWAMYALHFVSKRKSDVYKLDEERELTFYYISLH